LRDIFAEVLEKFLAKPIVKVENMPSFGKVFVTEQAGRRIVHLLSYVPELRGRTQIVEESVDLRNVKVSLRDDGRKVSKIYLAPEKEELQFTCADDYLEVTVPVVDGYAMLVFE
jgi:hypothetical protein